MRWNLATYLKRHNRSAYALVRASGLARGTVYAIARGEAKAVELDTLAKLAAGLEALTGEPVAVGDLLEVVGGPAVSPEPNRAAGRAELERLLAAARETARVDHGEPGGLPPRRPVPLAGLGPTAAEVIAEGRR